MNLTSFARDLWGLGLAGMAAIKRAVFSHLERMGNRDGFTILQGWACCKVVATFMLSSYLVEVMDILFSFL